MIQLLARRALVPVLVCALVATGAAGAASDSTPSVTTHFPFGKTAQAGVAVLGSRYVYAGTATSNILHILDIKTMRRVATWHLPSLGGSAYGMDRLTVSPDNRRLYIVNVARQDVVTIDVTGATAPGRWNLKGLLPVDARVSADSRRVYVVGSRGIDAYSALSGQHLAHVGGATEVTPAPDGGLYTISISTGRASVRYISAAGKSRSMLAWSGSAQTEKSGDIALSADGRIVYALWDSFKEIDARSGRLLRSVPLPLIPHFRWISLAPNDQQAMLTAPDYLGLYDTPGLNPAALTRRYGIIAGGALAVDLVHMQPIKAHLESVRSPRQLAYSSNSRLAFVSLAREIDALQTGSTGVDRAHLPKVSLHLGAAPGCTVSGAWTFATAAGLGGPGNGTAILKQTNTAVTGSLATTSGLAWTLQGSIHARGLVLTMRTQGRNDLSFTGVVSTDGKKIVGNLGTFANGHAQCR